MHTTYEIQLKMRFHSESQPPKIPLASWLCQCFQGKRIPLSAVLQDVHHILRTQHIWKAQRAGFRQPNQAVLVSLSRQDTKILWVVVRVRFLVGNMIQDSQMCHIERMVQQSRCMMLYDVVWCCMMLYDVVWCCRELAEMILPQLDSQGFWPFPGLTLVPL